MKCKIYLNGELVGYCDNPIEFTEEMREKRRSGKISHEMNITYFEDANEIYIFNDPGRARRPLIIVKEGQPLLKEEHLNKIANNKLKWDYLINNGIIEYLDAEEEENSYIAVTLADLTEEHTHLEIDPATMLGICAGIIPFSDHNSSPRNTMAAGMSKQALGLYVSNYAMRTDTRAHLLHHPQTPIVKTRITNSTNYDLRPSGQNFVVALMSYEGYNMEDAMVINKASLERGLSRSSFFRSYDTSEKRYAGGQVDRFEVPDIRIKGYRSEEAYRNLDEDGVVFPESYVESGDVLLGKTSPPRFLEEDFGTVADRRRETSVTVRHGEKGIVDAVLLSETSGGSRLAKVRVRDTRQPEFGDKFASRHGQKGVIGLILSPEDVPFTEDGIIPDLIVNPHAIPSRMSIGQILEIVAGKAGCLEGERVDATPFNQTIEDEIKQILMNNGFESAGCESLYDGVTGQRFEAEILIGVGYYQKLHHMTTDKVYARSRGPVQVITRQPTEGRAREGGLRFGEMERDCLIAHGAALTLKERLLDESDKYEAIVCENCGMLAVFDRNKNKKYCPICGYVETYPVEISYAFKLLLDEMKSMCIFPKLVLGDKLESKKPFKKKHYAPIKPAEENRTAIKGIRLVEEEPLNDDSETQNEEILENCAVCGKKLNKHQKNLCRACARKQYASRIIKKLVSVIKPGVVFKKHDLKALELDELQLKDYIWTLQEFDLIDVDINKFKLKDENTLNDFRIKSKLEPIDFDSVTNEDSFKICSTCGKNLPISHFYKTSEGYEDNCKECKKLVNAANYLNDVINYIGFGKEFSSIDLEKYFSNQNQVMGIIWSLQENDLIIENEPNRYVLADESICLKFFDRYHSEFKIKHMPKLEVKSEIELNVKSKSEGEGKSKFQSELNFKPKNNAKVKSKSKNNVQKIIPRTEKQEQMEIVLKAIEEGKSREEAAEIAGIKLYKIVHWYNEGNSGFGEDNISFYKRLKKIETKLARSKSIERNQMDFVLKLSRQGKSKLDVAQISGIKISKIKSWFDKGKNKESENTIYFYEEMNKIENKEFKNKSDKKSNLKTKSSKHSKKVKVENKEVTKNSLNKKSKTDNVRLNKKEVSKKDKIDKNILKQDTADKKVNLREDTKKEELNLDDEKVVMDKIISLMRKGYSRIQASQELGIKVGQIVIWYRQGANGHSSDTVNFYNQLNQIEKK